MGNSRNFLFYWAFYFDQISVGNVISVGTGSLTIFQLPRKMEKRVLAITVPFGSAFEEILVEWIIDSKL